tara:strand:+ start:10420 stop:10680 length:261 start_codon:yes stop_codon:yes gene_type:complete
MYFANVFFKLLENTTDTAGVGGTGGVDSHDFIEPGDGRMMPHFQPNKKQRKKSKKRTKKRKRKQREESSIPIARRGKPETIFIDTK